MARRPLLCRVLDRAAARRPIAASVRAAVAGGVDWVQVRDRGLDGSELLAHTDEVMRAARDGAAERSGPVRVIVNRRIDVALAARADGAHLGFDAMPAADARALLGAHALLGASLHSPREVAEAPSELDVVHLAPIFAPLSKAATRPALGVHALREAAGHGRSVLGQGGVTADNAAACLEAGACGVAVTGAVLSADDPRRAARALRAALDAT